MSRTLSHSEVSSALDCQAQHDFRYVGHLVGSALKPRATAVRLREGRAWGAAVAQWHADCQRWGVKPLISNAMRVLGATLDEDAAEQCEAGVYIAEEHTDLTVRLSEMLIHYVETAEPLPISRLEDEMLVGIPSRNGRRRSSRYRFLGYADGVHVDEEGRTWLVEFKLRGRLTSLEQIALSRQIRWYAWAYREIAEVEPSGVIVDERWNEIPKAARVNKGRGKTPTPVASHAVDQLTTPDRYVEACLETGEEPKAETVEAFGRRRWQQRHAVIFRSGELDEAGRQLVSAAKLIQQLDAGDLYPIRNPSPTRCGGCAFREICPNPNDVQLVDAFFRRVPAKRDRPAIESGAVAA
jgi:hypothetical protein